MLEFAQNSNTSRTMPLIWLKLHSISVACPNIAEIPNKIERSILFLFRKSTMKYLYENDTLRVGPFYTQGGLWQLLDEICKNRLKIMSKNLS